MKKNKKLLALVCCMALLVGAVGATIAWFIDQTETISNTFTVGDINITLDEVKVDEYGNYIATNEEGKEVVTDVLADADRIPDGDRLSNQYKLIPGFTYTKDPTVTVLANSEDCYLFVKFEELNNAADSNVDFIVYDSALAAENSGWTQGKGTDDVPETVWYRIVKKSEVPQVWNLITGNTITINDQLTKAHMEALNAAGANYYPELKFTAYAVQLYKTNGVEFSAKEAWEKLSQ